MYLDITLAELIKSASYAQKQDAHYPFTNDYVTSLLAVKVYPTVEQMLSRMFTSIETLLDGRIASVSIDDEYSLHLTRVRDKITRIEFRLKGEEFATILREEDVPCEIFGHLPKKVDLMRYTWPQWPPNEGTLEDEYKRMLIRTDKFQTACRRLVG